MRARWPLLFNDLLLYLNTARHLHWRQLVYRPLRALQRPVPRVRPTTPQVAAARVAVMTACVESWAPLDRSALIARADAVVAGRFEFVGGSLTLGRPDWNTRYADQLWTYHLHYFDFALDLAWAARLTGDDRYVEHFRAVVDSWITECREDSDGWQPYPLSLRTVNWIYSCLLLRDRLPGAFQERLLTSVHHQLAIIEHRLEWHILANHLQKNLYALAVGGLLFDTADARRWRSERMKQVWRELYEQVLPDGAHYERSPMYHALALSDHLRVLQLMDHTGTHVPDAARERIRSMVRALALLARRDGTLHAFNDAAEGMAPPAAEIAAHARRAFGASDEPPFGPWSLPNAGYYGFRSAVDELIVDCGQPGPDYQPGHAHCDMLSFELDVGGKPIVVDTGVRGYAADGLRQYVRSTAAHNTVAIGGREQHEIWGSFRVARRGAPLSADVHGDGDRFHFRGACRHYHAKHAVHQREVERAADGMWTIRDVVRGSNARLDSWLHLHPDVRARHEETHIELEVGDQVLRITPVGFDTVRLHNADDPEHGWYCPRFGTGIPAPVLRAVIEENDGRLHGWRIERIATP